MAVDCKPSAHLIHDDHHGFLNIRSREDCKYSDKPTILITLSEYQANVQATQSKLDYRNITSMQQRIALVVLVTKIQQITAHCFKAPYRTINESTVKEQPRRSMESSSIAAGSASLILASIHRFNVCNEAV